MNLNSGATIDGPSTLENARTDLESRGHFRRRHEPERYLDLTTNSISVPTFEGDVAGSGNLTVTATFTGMAALDTSGTVTIASGATLSTDNWTRRRARSSTTARHLGRLGLVTVEAGATFHNDAAVTFGQSAAINRVLRRLRVRQGGHPVNRPGSSTTPAPSPPTARTASLH